MTQIRLWRCIKAAETVVSEPNENIMIADLTEEKIDLLRKNQSFEDF